LKHSESKLSYSRAKAQAVSHWLSTAAARVRAQVRLYGFYGGQMALGQVFSEYFGFPCQFQILILPTAPHLSSSVIRGWYNWPVSGQRTKWTQSHPTSQATKQKLSYSFFLPVCLFWARSIRLIYSGTVWEGLFWPGIFSVDRNRVQCYSGGG
jgi:hypothetical protein